MRITWSPLVAGGSGKTADLVAASWKGRQYIRKLVIPANPNTAAQQAVRNSLAACVTLWRSLHATIKTGLDKYGIDYRMSGYNVFIGKNRALEQANSLLVPVPADPHCPVPSTLAFATGAGAGGTIDCTWVDDAPEDYDDIWVVARLSSGNQFQYLNTVAADLQTMTLIGLTAGADYDCYGMFYNSGTGQFGTSDGDLAVAAKA